MVLKIFTKRKTGGVLVRTGLGWTNKFIEADEICTHMENNVATINSKGETAQEYRVDLNTHGYEVLNNAGVTIERFVTLIKGEDR